MPRVHSDWIKAYMEYSAHSEAPDRFHFWTAVSTIAGALRRRVWIDMNDFQWTPNFYIVFVAPAGIVSKSTTAKIGMNILKQVPGIKFGPNVVTWQSLVEDLADSQENVMIEGDYYPMSPLTILSSEFGTFLDPKDKGMVDALVDLWDGQVGTFEKKTKSSGHDYVVNPWINIIAATTPSWIAENFPEYMIGGGFVSRTVFVFGDKKRHYCAYPDEAVSENYGHLKKGLVKDLVDIASNIKGPMRLSPEARAWGRNWYEQHYAAKPPHLQSERMASYYARRQTHMHKLAIVLAAAQNNDRVITEENLIAADMILSENEKNLPKVFEKIGDEVSQKANAISIHVQARGEVAYTEAFSEMFHKMSFTQFKEGVESSIKAGHITQVNKNGVIYLKCNRPQSSE